MINEILLIVHPFYFQSSQVDVFKTREGKHITKNELSNYGLLIKDAAKRQESVVLFIPSTFRRTREVIHEQRRLLKFARKEMKGRVILLPFVMGGFRFLHTPQAFDIVKKSRGYKDLQKLQFAPEVAIVKAGQYSRGCVQVGGENLTRLLSEKGVRVKSMGLAKISRNVEDLRLITRDILVEKKAKLKEYSKDRRKRFGKRGQTRRI